jgi:RNA polymerase sigma-70 factor, ECF subfamily
MGLSVYRFQVCLNDSADFHVYANDVNGNEAALSAGGYSLEQADGGEVELLRLARRGDVTAFEKIVRLHERGVFRVAYRVLGNVEDAQDAGQEVFLRLHKHLRSFDETRQLGPWLYRVTLNICNDALRSRRRVTVLPDLIAPERTDQPLDAAERRKMVADALASLPEKERAAVVLRDVEGMTTREVAALLGSSESTVRSQISTGRVKLKKLIDELLRRHS